jgi:hypothetical protein
LRCTIVMMAEVVGLAYFLTTQSSWQATPGASEKCPCPGAIGSAAAALAPSLREIQ